LNVFIDYCGHSDFYYSFHLLFEKRLGGQLFCPEGSEWHEKGFVKLRPPIPIAKIETVDDALKNPYVECEKVELIDGVYHYYRKMELDRGYYVQKAITFNEFLKMDFDVVVATHYEHEKTFYDLLSQYKPKAGFIRVINNIHEKPLGFCKNILLATLEPMPPDINCMRYHPENYEGYCYTPPTNHKTIKSFVGDLPYYPYDMDTWRKLESSLNDFTCTMYTRDNFVPHLLMPRAMKDSAFICHIKAHGGGGFTAYQALASGRPCIVKRQYAVLHGAPHQFLFVDSVNCVDLDLGVERGIEILKGWSQPDRHVEVCRATAEKFARDVNFAAEAEGIRAWLGSLKPL